MFGADDRDSHDATPPGYVTGLACVEKGCREVLVIGMAPWGWHYTCANERCKGSLPAMPDGAPKGKPRTQKIQSHRALAHDAFDYLWKSGYCTRSAAYRWMAQVMDLKTKDAHIVMLTEKGCLRLARLVTEKGPGTSFWDRWPDKGKKAPE